MPIYEYVCKDCQKEFESLRSMRTPIVNPLCVIVKVAGKPWQEVLQLPVDRVQAAAALAVDIKT
jgi:DNA-directed RNA polymerase subunit RPC12/RpoP